MPDLKEVIEAVLLPLQLSLGLFLIMKTTPLWAVIHCALASLLNFFHFPCTDYKQLGDFPGRVFKKVISHATTAGDVSKLKNQKDAKESKKSGKSVNDGPVSLEYLGKKFELERKNGNLMLMKDGPAYYITDKMWETVKYIEKVASKTVFVKNHKEIWEEVVTGDIMEFEEVLDSVILDNRAVIRLDHDYFLPVNLLLAEDKLQKTLNFVALFLKTQKNIYWLIPALLTFTAAVMGFSTTVRLSIVDCIGKNFCRVVRWVCDLLPSPIRRRVYYWGSWVESLKPGNDFQSKIVRGDISVLIAGGAKFYSQSLDGPIIFADHSVETICSGGGPFLFKCDSECDSNSHSLYIEWIFDKTQQKCLLKAGCVASKKVRLSLKPDETSIGCGDKKIKFFKSCKSNRSLRADDSHAASVDIDCCKAKEPLMADDGQTASVDIDCCNANRSLMADDSQTASVDIDCCKGNGSLMADDGQTASVDIDCCKAKESLMADDSETASVDIDCCKGNRSLMADVSHTASVDIDCCKANESLMADDGQTATVDIDCCKTNRSSMANDSQTASVDIDCCNAKESLMADDSHIVSVDKAKESLMADDIHTASVDIDCSAEEARKLFIFASYMAELQSGSLRSCYSNSKTVYVHRFVESINAYLTSGYPPLRNSSPVHVRRFVESINAYVRSGYPPLYKLHLQGVVVR